MHLAPLSILAFLFAGSVVPLPAQTASDLNEGSRLTIQANGAKTFLWWGRTGRTYFVQYSADLVNWNYLPTAQSGANQVISLGLGATPAKYFLKLQASDQTTTNPQTADFDGDGISNGNELVFGTNPMAEDTDYDGMRDAWELQWGMNARNRDANANGLSDLFEDFDGDGLSNEEEAIFNLNPYSADTDGDSMTDDYELAHDFDPTNSADGAEDPDLDGTSNALEAQSGSNPKDGVEPKLDRRVELWIKGYLQSWSQPSGPWTSEHSDGWDLRVWAGPSALGSEEPFDIQRLTTHNPSTLKGRAEYYWKNVGSDNPLEVKWVTWKFENYLDAVVTQLVQHTVSLGAGNSSSLNLAPYPEAGKGEGILKYIVFENAPESGFDNYERHSNTSTPQILPVPWLMVPVGQGYSNSAKIGFYGYGLQQLKLDTTSGELEIQGSKNINSSGPTTFTVASNTAGSGEFVTMTGRDAPTDENKIRIVRAVRYPLITMTVQPYKITCKYSDGRPPKVPQNLPGQSDLQTRLNRVFGDQMNVQFTVRSYIDKEIVYDIGDAQLAKDFPAVSGPNGNPSNGDFDMSPNPLVPSAEENAVYAEAYDGSADVCIYFLGTSVQANNQGVTRKLSYEIAGKARASQRAVFINNNITLDETFWVVCHEIGHLSLRLGQGLFHPRDTVDPSVPRNEGFPLMKLSDDRKRLMFSPGGKVNSNTGRMPSLLIYDEWKRFRGNTAP